jgi:high-affinity iron transporter
VNPKTPLPAILPIPNGSAASLVKAFNTASFGIEGTAMASFAALTEEQRWQVAFYIFTLRFSDEASRVGARLLQEKRTLTDLLTAATLATLSDDQLLEKLKNYTAQEAEAMHMLVYLRRGHLQTIASDPLSIARGLLREAVELYGKGDKDKAYQKAVEAYLDGYELAEPTLFAKDAGFGRAGSLFHAAAQRDQAGRAQDKFKSATQIEVSYLRRRRLSPATVTGG